MRSLSVVIPVYNEASQLPRTLEVLRGVLGELADLRWTFVLVDDGSRDGTWEVIRAESARGDVRGLRLSRNFGKEAALCAGLEAASGDGCLVLDGDLQHPPELIPSMVDLWGQRGLRRGGGGQGPTGRREPPLPALRQGVLPAHEGPLGLRL